MHRSHEAAARLSAIDALQNDLLRRLDELERQTLAVLEQYQPAMAAAAKSIISLPAQTSPAQTSPAQAPPADAPARKAA